MRYSAIDNQLFIENRKQFVAKMKPNSIAVFFSNDLMPQSADQEYPFKQNPDFFYLTGIDQEECMMILYPDCPDKKQKEVLFLKETSDLIAIWHGQKISLEEGKKISGIQQIKLNTEFNAVLNMMMKYADHVYLNLNEHDRSTNEVPYRDLRFATEIRTRYPIHSYHRAAPILSDLRTIKKPAEVDLIQQACNITGKGFRRTLGFVKPGVWEYEIEAELLHEFISNRATGFAYEPIIASGTDSCVLHYIRNDKQCKDGELLLMDVAADYANYRSDLTRTIPVNGKFSKRQRELYDAVLRSMKFCFSLIKPGTSFESYNEQVSKFVEEEIIKLKLISADDIKKQNPNLPAYKKYFMHGVSHFIGLDVHDVGTRFGKMEAGMVLTVEPGIYIREEGFGVRIENDVVITESGYFDLMKDIPSEAEEIEQIMNS